MLGVDGLLREPSLFLLHPSIGVLGAPASLDVSAAAGEELAVAVDGVTPTAAPPSQPKDTRVVTSSSQVTFSALRTEVQAVVIVRLLLLNRREPRREESNFDG